MSLYSVPSRPLLLYFDLSLTSLKSFWELQQQNITSLFTIPWSEKILPAIKREESWENIRIRRPRSKGGDINYTIGAREDSTN